MALARFIHLRPGVTILALVIALMLGALVPALAEDSTGGALSAGWNLIGPPSDTAVALADCQVRNAASGQTLSLGEAWIAGWITLPIYYYQDGGYRTCGLETWDDSNALPPMAGAWCYVSQPGVELVFQGTRLHAGYGVALSLDRPFYYINAMPPVPPGGPAVPTAYLCFTVFNWTDLPVNFTFCDCQRFDFEIYDRAGKLMWRWSDGKMFCDALGSEQIIGRELVYKAAVPLRNSSGPYPDGLYKLVGYLTTGCSPASAMQNTARGEITFEVKWIY